MNRLTILPVSCSLLLCPIVTFAHTIHIPADSSTIQSGINGASDGDTILVADGIYTGPGNRDIDFLGKILVVMSERGPQSTLIDCEADSIDPHRGFSFSNGEDTTSVLKGFTITNGWYERAAAIHCYSSSPLIEDNIIIQNTALTNGGGISCEISANPIIRKNSIINNSSGRGGGIYCFYSSPLIEGNDIIGNSVENVGGGIDCRWSSPIISKNDIFDNVAFGFHDSGGGINLAELSDAFIVNNRITGNIASGDGGGIIFSQDSHPIITGNIITLNSADAGGGIMSRRCYATIENNTVLANTASENGGGIWSKSAELLISNCIIRENSATEIDGDDFLLSYSNVRGGWPGDGNIDADPYFIDPENSDYRLLPDSPCIDAGDPNSEIPDDGGDRIDMGAFEYPYPATSPVHLSFGNTPSMVSQGESITWAISITNSSHEPAVLDEWVMVNGPRSSFLDSLIDLSIPPLSVYEGYISLLIPPTLIPGHYTVKGRVGLMHLEIWDGALFDVTVDPENVP